jgi:hypothetical protein
MPSKNVCSYEDDDALLSVEEHTTTERTTHQDCDPGMHQSFMLVDGRVLAFLSVFKACQWDSRLVAGLKLQHC